MVNVPKTGTTLFKLLAVKVNTGRNLFTKVGASNTRHQDDQGVHRKNSKHIEEELDDVHLLADKNKLHNLETKRAKILLAKLPRLLITRNPYVRHISAWQDFLRRNSEILEAEGRIKV